VDIALSAIIDVRQYTVAFLSSFSSFIVIPGNQILGDVCDVNPLMFKTTN
jgi:hypothetical protein